jgi:hypothetical protein
MSDSVSRRGDAALSRAEREGPCDPYRLYKYTEYAEPLNITIRQAQRWLYDGTLPYVQYATGRRVRGRDLNAFVNARLVRPGE